MLKVLLVDDEPFILQGIKVIIDWEKEGFEIAATAENGLEALEYLKTINEQIQNIAQKKDTLCRRMYN